MLSIASSSHTLTKSTFNLIIKMSKVHKFIILATILLADTTVILANGGSRRNANKFLDLTYSLSNETVLWPGKKLNFYIESDGYTEGGFWVASRGFCTSEHSSTHVDAPYHCKENGRKLHEIPLEDMIDIPGVMIDIYDKVHTFKDGELSVIDNYVLTRQDVLEWEAKNGRIPPGSVVLLRTGWASRWGNKRLYRGEIDEDIDSSEASSFQPTQLNFPSFDVSSAEYLAVERQVLGVGVDTLSIDPGNSKTFPAHLLFASKNVYMLENVANLDALPPRGFNLWIVPFKIDFGTGAPTRILAKLNSNNKVQ